MKPNSENISPIHLENLCKGIPEAQRRLYDQYSPKMFAICLRYASNTEEAEDILQEGFLKIFHNIHKYRGEGSFEGWMRRIFVNKAIERFHKKQIYLQEINENTVNNISHITSSSSGFDNLAIKDMLRLIQSLSDGYRTVFNLFVIEGFTHPEIAKLLNISESTSKSQLSRAKAMLQKMLAKEEKVA